MSPCPGKCLPQAATPLLCRLWIIAAPPRHAVGIFGQRAVADDRILRVGVDVEHGRVVERDAHGAQFGGQCLGEPFGDVSCRCGQAWPSAATR